VRILIEIFSQLYRRVKAFFTGESRERTEFPNVTEEGRPSEPCTKPEVHSEEIPVPQPVLPVNEGKWTIRPCRPQTFEKVGRVFFASDSGKDYLAIRCDQSDVQYMLRRADLDSILNEDVSCSVRRDTGSASGGMFAAG